MAAANRGELIIIIHTGLEEVDIKSLVLPVDAGVGGMAEAVGHLEGQLGGEGNVNPASHLRGEVKGVGDGRAIDAFADHAGAPYSVDYDPGEEEETRLQHGGDAHLEAGLFRIGHAEDAFGHEGEAKGAQS